MSFGGDLASKVTLSVSTAAGSLGALTPYLRLEIEEGTGGAFGSCSGFVPTAVDWSGTATALQAQAGSPATGIGFFNTPGTGVARTYRITWTLSPSAPGGLEGQAASLSFAWTAQNSASEAPVMGSTGSNGQHELGDGGTVDRSSFAASPGTAGYAQIDGGGSHACAVRANRSLWCWGSNSDGQLGVGDTAGRLEPAQVGTDTNWRTSPPAGCTRARCAPTGLCGAGETTVPDGSASGTAPAA